MHLFHRCYPISGATFTQEGYTVQKLAASNVGAITLVIFVLLRLYSGWGYVGSRLKNKAIEYEETGWYDGDIEFKSEPEKQRDMFLYKSNVKPVEDRIKLFSAGAAVFWMVSCVGLNAALTNMTQSCWRNCSMMTSLQALPLIRVSVDRHIVIPGTTERLPMEVKDAVITSVHIVMECCHGTLFCNAIFKFIVMR
jgi:Conserved in the green lineage and diatoms 27